MSLTPKIHGYCFEQSLAKVESKASLNYRFKNSLVIQSLSHVRLFVTPWTAACQHFLPVLIIVQLVPRDRTNRECCSLWWYL